ncbi:hypothetical protein [Mesonia aestuariivivens]|uniref:LVIVD repeat-containing protein n=1 Tax=Mesonia aestuariivivens TaxID=2796128 RepID=A0ABS6VZ18_9FLAO|nr:hypothetical protein [Mesonia aestuariivivens]MBW2960506.1 hypothetical protein [Mesonia aestuariivivens]
MFKNNYLFFSAAAAFIFLLQSCQTEYQTESLAEQLENEEIIIQDADATRLSTENLGVVGFKNVGVQPTEIPRIRTLSTNEEVSSTDLPLITIASVNPPSIGGTLLKATQVAIHENYAYVSYNVEGDEYKGAIDVIDISDPENPLLASQVIFPNTDINAIVYSNGNLFVAGANPSLSIEGTDPALLFRIGLVQDLPVTNDLTLIDMPGFSGVDVTVDGNRIYGVSGDNGVLARYNQNGNLQNSISITDLRAVGINNNQLVALSGTTGVYVYNANNLSQTLNFSTLQDVPEAKRTIAFYNNQLLAAEGTDGVGIYDLNSGNQINTLPLPALNSLPSTIDPAEVVTNAVTTIDNYIIVAQGSAGVSLFEVGNDVTDVNNVGILDLDDSANYVKGEGEYLFVANGGGGLKIIKRLTTVPSAIDGSIACENFPPYTGLTWMSINSNQEKAYSGTTSVSGIQVKGDLTYCGNLAVSQAISITSNGNFFMSGSLVQGTTTNPLLSFEVKSNALAQIEGSVTIYGNLNMSSGGTLQINGDLTVYGNVNMGANSTLEFQGNSSTANVHGTLNRHQNSTVSGQFIDTQSKF